MRLHTIYLLALINAFGAVVRGFIPPKDSKRPTQHALNWSQQQQQQQRIPLLTFSSVGLASSSSLSAVTEDDVVALVENAESLWADALEARKTANALSDRAEEEAEAAATSAVEADAMMKEGAISVEKIAFADRAANSNLDAGSMVEKAVLATEEADKLQELADVALRESEEALEQHLKDFPDSPLAE